MPDGALVADEEVSALILRKMQLEGEQRERAAELEALSSLIDRRIADQEVRHAAWASGDLDLITGRKGLIHA